MRKVLTSLAICLLLCPYLLAAETGKPNIIVILADDLGYGDVGCFGAQDIRTPHLDKTAAEGLRLSSFYAQPICGPSRAALMTGCYPIRIGEVANGKNGHTQLHTKEVTMAEMLRDSGYRTGIVGWPGKVRSGEVSDEIVSALDLMPTFATFAKAGPTGTNLDGLGLADFLTNSGASSPRDTFLYYNGTRLCAVRHKEWKLVFARPARGDMPYMPDWLTGHIEPLHETRLFNLLTDPAESNNLSAEHPAVVKQLADLAEQSRTTLGDHTGPGKEARFFEPGEHWPAVITSTESPQKNPLPYQKPNTIHESTTPLFYANHPMLRDPHLQPDRRLATLYH